MNRRHTATPIKEHFDGLAHSYGKLSLIWPWSWLRAREARAIGGLLGDVRARTALDLGCGAGFYTRRLLSWGAAHVYAVDFSPAMVDALPSLAITGICADVCEFKLEQRFEIIVAAGILEFISEPTQLFRSARHHTTEGGRLVYLAPANNLSGRFYRRHHRSHGFDIQLFDRKTLVAVANTTGWRTDEISTVFPFGIAACLTAIPEI